MTSLRDKVKVESLAPGRVARIEENVIAAYRESERTRTPGKRTLAMAMRYFAPAAAACGVAFAIFVNLRGANRQPTRPVVVAPSTPELTGVSTGVGERARLELGDAAIQVGAETSIEINRASGGEITVVLRAGRVDCDVEPRAGRAPFAVRAGDVDVTVVGTAFSVERDEMVRVKVTRGRVTVSSPDGAKSLAANQEWTGRATRVAMADPPAAADPPAPTAETRRPAKVDEPGAALPARRVSKVPDAPETKGGKTRKAPDEGAEAEVASPTQARAPEPTARAKARAMLPTVDSEDLADAQGAVEKYAGEIGAGGHSEREALYRTAYLQLFTLNDRRAALETVELFQRRFRGGAFTEDVLCLRILATCRGGEPSAACRRAAHAYLNDFPDGRYAQLAQDIVDPM